MLHPSFPQPKDTSQKIWRYMDLGKFIDLIQTSCLHFSRLDQMDDRWEGATSKLNGEFYKKIESDPELLKKYYPTLNINEEIFRNIQLAISKEREALRKAIYINCWYLSNFESAAMWYLYSKSNESIAIQSRYHVLLESLPNHAYCGLITYRDYETEIISDENLFNCVMSKRRSFEHENEVRALWWNPDLSRYDPEDEWNKGSPSALPQMDFLMNDAGTGAKLRVDLGVLVEAVYVSPSSQNWFHDVVAGVVRQFGFSFPVRKSTLSEDPVY